MGASVWQDRDDPERPMLFLRFLAACAATAGEPVQYECTSIAVQSTRLADPSGLDSTAGVSWATTKLPKGWQPIGGAGGAVIACRQGG
jgi:hypothetical protein